MMDGANKVRPQLKINGNISFPSAQIGFVLAGFVAWLRPPRPPAHFQMLIRSETINKSMAAALAGDCFQGAGEGRREVDLNHREPSGWWWWGGVKHYVWSQRVGRHP